MGQKMTEQTVLVADLDGTLCRTDTLHEAILRRLAANPASILRMIGWLFQGKRAFKDHMARAGIVAPDELVYRPEVIEALNSARAEGRRTALVSASDHRQVQAIADHFGIFDDIQGSTPERNLKADEKAAYLTETYGKGGFEYIGDSRADLVVWSQAAKAVTVNAGPALARAAEAACPGGATHIAPPENKLRHMVRAMRPHQWSKNGLLFVPLLASHNLAPLGSVLLGVLAFCLTASTVYVINDLLDLPADRAHPRKCKRPFASGKLSAGDGLAMAGVMVVLAMILGLATGNPSFLGVLLAYFVATFAYSLLLKRKLIIDVLTLAGLYTIRIVAGGAAAGIVLSPWLLSLSMFLFLALAAIKRQAELEDQKVTGRSSSGRAYEVEDLPILRGTALAATQAAVVVMTLYISSADVQLLYTQPQALWLICPLLLYWLLRMIMKAHRGEMSDDPIVFAATDRVSLLVIGLSFVVAVWAAFG